MSDDVLRYLASALAQEEDAQQQRLKAIRAARRTFQRRRGVPTLRFRIVLSSLWKAEGERDVEMEGTGSLQMIIACAVSEFKQRNHRADVQANWHIQTILPSGLVMDLPSKLWDHLRP